MIFVIGVKEIPSKYIRILTILHKLDGCVKMSNIDIQLSNKSAVSSTVTDRAWCNTKEGGFTYLEAFGCVCVHGESPMALLKTWAPLMESQSYHTPLAALLLIKVFNVLTLYTPLLTGLSKLIPTQIINNLQALKSQLIPPPPFFF